MRSIFAALFSFALPFSAMAQVPESCEAPVNMMILSIVQDDVRYADYRESLGASGLIEAYGGKVTAVGTRFLRPPDVLEGEWPDNRHMFTIRFPCAAAAKAFLTADIYVTEYLPKRRGAGQFNIALFPAID